MPCATITAAARLCEDHGRCASGSEMPPRGRDPRSVGKRLEARLERPPASTWEERCWATASIQTTGTCPICATAPPSAASIRVPESLPSTRRRPRRCSGVVRVITAADIPGENKVGHLKHDQYSLIPIGGLTHYLGDAIALVVAETPEILEKAKKARKGDL